MDANSATNTMTPSRYTKSPGLIAAIKASAPGPPPTGWRDITKVWTGKEPGENLGALSKEVRAAAHNTRNMLKKQYNCLLAFQWVRSQGRLYQRVAVAQASHLPVTNTYKPRKKRK